MVGQEPEELNDLEVAEELGAKRAGDELYDYPGLASLLEYYGEEGEYLPDND